MRLTRVPDLDTLTPMGQRDGTNWAGAGRIVEKPVGSVADPTKPRGTLDGLLEVQCWCGKEIVRLSPADVQAGITKECSPGCRARFHANGLPKPRRPRHPAST